MKLLNQSFAYLSISILVLIGVWSVIFYVNMLDEIYDSIDDGLDNYKMLIIKKVDEDATVLEKNDFGESNYEIRPITETQAHQIRDTYRDTLLYMPYEEDLEPVRILTSAFAHEGKYYKLDVISSMVEEDDLIEDLFWAIFWLYFLLLLSILLINNLVLRKLWRPFYTLLEELKNFRINKASTLPDIHTTTKEFRELQSACDALIGHTLEAYTNQKQFTENAAHELQTPLAVITSKLELLLEKNSMEPADAETVAQTLQITSRLTTLNKSLLLLSRIENKQFFDNKPISINALTKQILEDLMDFSAYKELKIELVDTHECAVKMDPMLANILLGNLVKNAVFHTASGGKVRILITAQAWKVTNSAEAGPLEAEDIFKRFYKNNSSQQSTGLGLAIVQAICKLYQFSVSYSYEEGHCFTVDFPKQ